VLIDGMRVSPYAFAVNGSDQFFDLNTLPLNIIDRIEIVKTGAVSQYGSDAIAGVVNIITKKNFQGLELGGSYGGATNGEGGQGTTQFSVLGGIGDLNADRFNVTAALSYYKSNGISIADRDTTQNQDFSNFPGGLSNQNVSYWRNPTTGAKVPLSPSERRPGRAGHLRRAGQRSGHGLRKQHRVRIVAVAVDRTAQREGARRLQDRDAMQAFADLWESNNTTVTNNFVGRLGNNTQTYDPATGGLNPVSNLVPGSNRITRSACRPSWSTRSRPRSRAHELELLACRDGVKGSFSTPRVGDWDWTASYTHSQNTVSNNYSNLINAAALRTSSRTACSTSPIRRRHRTG
jgi:iron complex outermembrane receptor protein